jgi:ribosomal protein S18 acetylase RimI-like enzyme
MKTAETTVRRAAAGDAGALSRLFRESWELAYRGIIPHLKLEAMIRGRHPEWWRRSLANDREHLLVLEFAGTIAGYASLGRNRWPLPQEGEIYELYLGPIYQGVGLGEQLFEGARHALDMRRLRGMIVWVLADNEGAIAFYRHRGGRLVARANERLGGRALPKLCFGWD